MRQEHTSTQPNRIYKIIPITLAPILMGAGVPSIDAWLIVFPLVYSILAIIISLLLKIIKHIRNASFNVLNWALAIDSIICSLMVLAWTGIPLYYTDMFADMRVYAYFEHMATIYFSLAIFLCAPLMVLFIKKGRKKPLIISVCVFCILQILTFYYYREWTTSRKERRSLYRERPPTRTHIKNIIFNTKYEAVIGDGLELLYSYYGDTNDIDVIQHFEQDNRIQTRGIYEIFTALKSKIHGTENEPMAVDGQE